MDVEDDAEEELYQPFQQEEKQADEKEGSDMASVLVVIKPNLFDLKCYYNYIILLLFKRHN